MLNHVALEGDGFADDIDFVEFAADIDEWLVLRVFRLEYEFLFVGIIIHAFERCFVPDDDGSNLAVFDHVLRAAEDDVTVVNARADHAVAEKYETKISFLFARKEEFIGENGAFMRNAA